MISEERELIAIVILIFRLKSKLRVINVTNHRHFWLVLIEFYLEDNLIVVM